MIPSLPIKATTVLDSTNIDVQPTPRVTLITKLNADEPEFFVDLIKPLRETDRDAKIEALTKLRDLCYDADNKIYISHSNLGIYELMVEFINKDKEVARVKALGVLLTLAVNDDINKSFLVQQLGLLNALCDVLREDQFQFDQTLRDLLSNLEILWNTTPTTYQIQREIGFIKKELKIIRQKKSYMEQARITCLALLFKLSSHDSNRKVIGEKDNSILDVLTDIVNIDQGDSRLKSLDIIYKLCIEKDNRQRICSSELSLLNVLYDVALCENLEVRFKILSIMSILLEDNVIFNSENATKLPSCMKKMLELEFIFLKLKQEELKTAGNRLTVIELDIINTKSREELIFDILIQSNVFNSSIYDPLLDVNLIMSFLYNLTHFDEFTGLQTKSIKLIAIFSGNHNHQLIINDPEVNLLGNLFDILNRDQATEESQMLHEYEIRCLICTVIQNIPNLAIHSHTENYASFISTIIKNLKFSHLNLQSSMLNILLSWTNDTSFLSTLLSNQLLFDDSCKEMILSFEKEVDSENSLKILENKEAISNIQKIIGDTKKQTASNKKKVNKKVNKQNNISPQVMIEKNKKSENSIETSLNKVLNVSYASHEQPEGSSEQNENIEITSDNDMPNDEANDEDDYDEIRSAEPIAPSSLKPSSKTPRTKSFLESGLTAWQYLGYFGKK